MMDKTQSELAEGQDAADLLDSRGWQRARAAFLSGLEAQRRKAPIKDVELHTKLVLLEQCFLALEGWLENCRTTGKMAAYQLDQDRKRKEFQVGPVTVGLRR